MGIEPHYRALRLIAEAAALSGGRLAHERFGTPVVIRRKKDGSEVTEVDELTQAAIIREIRRVRPEDAFIGEEVFLEGGLPTPTNERVCWIIDPVDGTRNYIRAMPDYACAVAAVLNGEPVAATTYLPATKTLFSTSLWEPLYVNGEPLRGALAESLGDRSPTPVVSLPSQARSPVRERVHAWLDRFVGRNYGSSAMHLALVGSGQIQGCLLADCRIWDIAGGVLLVRSAGGVVVTHEGGAITPFDVMRDIDVVRPCIAASSAAMLRTLMG